MSRIYPTSFFPENRWVDSFISSSVKHCSLFVSPFLFQSREANIIFLLACHSKDDTQTKSIDARGIACFCLFSLLVELPSCEKYELTAASVVSKGQEVVLPLTKAFISSLMDATLYILVSESPPCWITIYCVHDSANSLRRLDTQWLGTDWAIDKVRWIIVKEIWSIHSCVKEYKMCTISIWVVSYSQPDSKLEYKHVEPYMTYNIQPKVDLRNTKSKCISVLKSSSPQ